jgi:RimJ/RimL family protein N-acetyltransferase
MIYDVGFSELQVGDVYRGRFGRTVLEADNVWFTLLTLTWLHRWRDNGIGPFIVERDGRVLGRVGYLIWDRATWQISRYAEAAEPETELGWTLAQEHWGHGYATEAARAARDWANVERLISLINPQNVRSMRVAEKLGAQPTETVTLRDESPAVVWLHPT